MLFIGTDPANVSAQPFKEKSVGALEFRDRPVGPNLVRLVATFITRGAIPDVSSRTVIDSRLPRL